MSYFKPSAVATTFGAKVFKAANGLSFTSARLSFAAGKNGHFPKFVSYLSQSRLTPLMAVIFNCGLRKTFLRRI